MNNSFPPRGIRETRSSEIGSINNKASSIPKQIHLQGKYIRTFFSIKTYLFLSLWTKQSKLHIHLKVYIKNVCKHFQ